MLGSVAVLAGCVALTRTAPVPGDTVADAQAKFGPPTAVYPTPNGQVLEYAAGPMGQYTWMANVGPDGRLVSFEQVLTGEKFATLKIGKARKEDVLRTIGRPAETSFLSPATCDVISKRLNPRWSNAMEFQQCNSSR